MKNKFLLVLLLSVLLVPVVSFAGRTYTINVRNYSSKGITVQATSSSCTVDINEVYLTAPEKTKWEPDAPYTKDTVIWETQESGNATDGESCAAEGGMINLKITQSNSKNLATLTLYGQSSDDDPYCLWYAKQDLSNLIIPPLPPSPGSGATSQMNLYVCDTGIDQTDCNVPAFGSAGSCSVGASSDKNN